MISPIELPDLSDTGLEANLVLHDHMTLSGLNEEHSLLIQHPLLYNLVFGWCQHNVKFLG
jgi:hypothetical protein